jgi:hypothetical protein
MRPVFDRWHDLPPGVSIGAELIGDDPPGRTTLFLQKALQ